GMSLSPLLRSNPEEMVAWRHSNHQSITTDHQCAVNGNVLPIAGRLFGDQYPGGDIGILFPGALPAQRKDLEEIHILGMDLFLTSRVSNFLRHDGMINRSNQSWQK